MTPIITFWPESRSALLVAAIAAEMLLSFLPLVALMLPRPVMLMRRTSLWLTERLNRKQRSNRTLFARGVIVAIMVMVFGLGAGVWLQDLLLPLQHGMIVEGLLLVLMLDAGKTLLHSRLMANSVDKEGLTAGRETVAHLAGGTCGHLDKHGVYRAAVEFGVAGWLHRFLSPLLFYLLFGLPGLFLQRFVHTSARAVSYPYRVSGPFGFTLVRLDDLFNFVPARLATLILTLAAVFVPSGRPLAAARTAMKQAADHFSPNMGWLEGAVAGALDLSLGGPSRYGLPQPNGRWIGGGRARLTRRDVRRANWLYFVSSLIVLALLTQLAIMLNG